MRGEGRIGAMPGRRECVTFIKSAVKGKRRVKVVEWIRKCGMRERGADTADGIWSRRANNVAELRERPPAGGWNSLEAMSETKRAVEQREALTEEERSAGALGRERLEMRDQSSAQSRREILELWGLSENSATSTDSVLLILFYNPIKSSDCLLTTTQTNSDSTQSFWFLGTPWSAMPDRCQNRTQKAKNTGKRQLNRVINNADRFVVFFKDVSSLSHCHFQASSRISPLPSRISLPDDVESLILMTSRSEHILVFAPRVLLVIREFMLRGLWHALSPPPECTFSTTKASENGS